MIEFTDHAKRKIKQRNLKEDWIRKALEKPQYIKVSYADREIAYRKIGQLYLAVIFVKEGENLVVITAHWEKGFKPK